METHASALRSIGIRTGNLQVVSTLAFDLPPPTRFLSTMTLDILHFIDAKGGNAEEIRESQRKRGLSDEVVDEVIQMYADWVKSACDRRVFARQSPYKVDQSGL